MTNCECCVNLVLLDTLSTKHNHCWIWTLWTCSCCLWDWCRWH